MSSNVLGNKDINAPIMSEQDQVLRTKDIKSMEYHREVLKSKMEERYVLFTYIPRSLFDSLCISS